MITCLWSQDSYMYSKFGLRLMVGHRHQDILKMFVAYIISFLWVAGKASLVKKKKTKKKRFERSREGGEFEIFMEFKGVWSGWWNLPVNAGDISVAGSIPGLGISPGEGNGNPLQYSCLENSMDRRAWWATVHGVLKSRT